MNKVIVAILALALVGVALLLMLEHQKEARIHQDNESLRQQAAQVPDLAAENERLSNLVAQAASTRSADQKELSRLRRETATLRTQTNEVAKLRAENAALRQQQTQVAAAPQGREIGTNSYMELVSPEAQQRRVAIAKMNDARTLMLALIMFADDNQSQLPPSLDATKPYLPQSGSNPTGTQTNQFEMVYQGSLQDLADRSTAVVIREKEAWPTISGAYSRAYGFADGHVEVATTADGNFGPWEDKHPPKLKGQ